jgi:hypothetical protein
MKSNFAVQQSSQSSKKTIGKSNQSDKKPKVFRVQKQKTYVERCKKTLDVQNKLSSDQLSCQALQPIVSELIKNKNPPKDLLNQKNLSTDQLSFLYQNSHLTEDEKIKVLHHPNCEYALINRIVSHSSCEENVVSAALSIQHNTYFSIQLNACTAKFLSESTLNKIIQHPTVSKPDHLWRILEKISHQPKQLSERLFQAVAEHQHLSSGVIKLLLASHMVDYCSAHVLDAIVKSPVLDSTNALQVISHQNVTTDLLHQVSQIPFQSHQHAHMLLGFLKSPHQDPALILYLVNHWTFDHQSAISLIQSPLWNKEWLGNYVKNLQNDLTFIEQKPDLLSYLDEASVERLILNTELSFELLGSILSWVHKYHSSFKCCEVLVSQKYFDERMYEQALAFDVNDTCLSIMVKKANSSEHFSDILNHPSVHQKSFFEIADHKCLNHTLAKKLTNKIDQIQDIEQNKKIEIEIQALVKPSVGNDLVAERINFYAQYFNEKQLQLILSRQGVDDRVLSTILCCKQISVSILDQIQKHVRVNEEHLSVIINHCLFNLNLAKDLVVSEAVTDELVLNILKIFPVQATCEAVLKKREQKNSAGSEAIQLAILEYQILSDKWLKWIASKTKSTKVLNLVIQHQKAGDQTYQNVLSNDALNDELIEQLSEKKLSTQLVAFAINKVNDNDELIQNLLEKYPGDMAILQSMLDRESSSVQHLDFIFSQLIETQLQAQDKDVFDKLIRHSNFNLFLAEKIFASSALLLQAFGRNWFYQQFFQLLINRELVNENIINIMINDQETPDSILKHLINQYQLSQFQLKNIVLVHGNSHVILNEVIGKDQSILDEASIFEKILKNNNMTAKFLKNIIIYKKDELLDVKKILNHLRVNSQLLLDTLDIVQADKDILFTISQNNNCNHDVQIKIVDKFDKQFDLCQISSLKSLALKAQDEGVCRRLIDLAYKKDKCDTQVITVVLGKKGLSADFINYIHLTIDKIKKSRKDKVDCIKLLLNQENFTDLKALNRIIQAYRSLDEQTCTVMLDKPVKPKYEYHFLSAFIAKQKIPVSKKNTFIIRTNRLTSDQCFKLYRQLSQTSSSGLGYLGLKKTLDQCVFYLRVFASFLVGISVFFAFWYVQNISMLLLWHIGLLSLGYGVLDFSLRFISGKLIHSQSFLTRLTKTIFHTTLLVGLSIVGLHVLHILAWQSALLPFLIHSFTHLLIAPALIHFVGKRIAHSVLEQAFLNIVEPSCQSAKSQSFVCSFIIGSFNQPNHQYQDNHSMIKIKHN